MENRRIKDRYQVIPDEVSRYKKEGYLVLDNVLTEEELQTLDYWFDHFISGKEMSQMKKDFCDMSQPYGTPLEDFQLVNSMLPSVYREELKGNIFQRIGQSIADQLYAGIAEMDYEQFLAKKPSKTGATFAMHQDLGYWPKTKNTWTATLSLALSDSTMENGCLQVIPGSNKEAQLRPHLPIVFDSNFTNNQRGDAHTLVIEEKPDDKVTFLPIKRGSITIHDERIVHGSAGNKSNHWRKTYILAFRDQNTIREERAMGFTHSHNDDVDGSKIIST